MNDKPWIWRVTVPILAAIALWAGSGQTLGARDEASTSTHADSAAGLKEFTNRLHAYLALRKTVASTLPALKPTDLPEMIAAHQQALARKLREARPRATPGDIFTPAACAAFRQASRAALEGAGQAGPHPDAAGDEPSPTLRLTVNGVYPDTEPVAPLPPQLLAAFPPLPAEVAYRFVGRTLVLVDVESQMIVDIAERILPSGR